MEPEIVNLDLLGLIIMDLKAFRYRWFDGYVRSPALEGRDPDIRKDEA